MFVKKTFQFVFYSKAYNTLKLKLSDDILYKNLRFDIHLLKRFKKQQF